MAPKRGQAERTVTIKDIARKLGVSHTTVSRALNNSATVNSATKRAVLQEANLMEYVPNLAARGLARGRSNTIAVATSSFFSGFFKGVMRGIEPEMIKTKFEIVCYSTGMFTAVGTENRDVLLYEKILNEKRADALILAGGSLAGERNIIRRYREAGIHVIFIEGKGPWGSRVHYDNHAAAQAAALHLKKSGRKRTGMLTGDTVNVESFKERKQGFTAAAGNGAEKRIFEFREDSPEMIKNALAFFKAAGVDGIYCASGDEHAVRLMEEAERAGIRMPRDMAIVGQDDTDAAAAAGLTSVRQPLEEMGRKAVEMAAEAMINKDQRQKDEMFYPELIVRQSC